MKSIAINVITYHNPHKNKTRKQRTQKQPLMCIAILFIVKIHIRLYY